MLKKIILNLKEMPGKTSLFISQLIQIIFSRGKRMSLIHINDNHKKLGSRKGVK
jgi:hypothetical protein